jgi:2-C-methyl-D-erythritol 4-phosphate cytidylyltransferase
MNSISAIITAGGIGKRMGGEIPKQFLRLNNRPVLVHTLESMHAMLPDAEILITLPEDWKNYWTDLLKAYDCTVEHRIVSGGEERYHSVRNAVLASTGSIVLIHDGVRPLVSFDTITRCLHAVERFGTAVPVVPLKESLRRISGDHSAAVDRSLYRLVQTPQCFRREILLAAYDLPYHAAITDDASLVEEAGHVIHTVAGNEENIKITTPADLELAEIHLSRDRT